VLWRCWLGGRKGIRPVKKQWWGAGVVVCLERGADLRMVQLMPLSLTVSCFSKIQIGFTFLVPAHPGSRAFEFGQKSFDSIRFSLPNRFFRFDSPIWYICRLYTDIQIVMMVSLVKGLAASLCAVVHSVLYQYELDNFQQVKNVSKVLNAANSDSAYFLAETIQ